jgi:two-component system, chemotaxis family, CheB/CheR fusion protein
VSSFRHSCAKLTRELRHRVGNILHIASALFDQSVKNHQSLNEVQATYKRQLQALASAQRLIFDASEHPITLGELIAQVVAPYGQSRFNLDSESIFVSEKSVVPIALVLNELATNAVKYGSLSQRDGKVDIHCQGNGDKVQIKWVEQGGPQVTQDQRKGFGRQLLERTIAGQLGGTLSIEFPTSGIVARITLAASRI